MPKDYAELGSFEVTSGKLRVTDPCYAPDTWCAGTLENVKNGTWHASVEYSDGRVARLDAHTNGGQFQSLTRTNIKVGVDSGQAGVFDASKYPEEVGEFDGSGNFYDRCCNLTLGDVGGGVIEFGAVSSTGWGDGSYTCDVGKNRDGQIVSVRLEFIGEPDLCEECGAETYDGNYLCDSCTEEHCEEEQTCERCGDTVEGSSYLCYKCEDKCD